MNDCPRVEFRDRLPELVHERLDVVERAAVLAHVEGCDDCRAELELLRGMRAVLSVGPRVDIGRIVQSLPAPSRLTKPKRRLRDWQLAAAGVVLFIGGVSLVTYEHGRGRVDSVGASRGMRAESTQLAIGKTPDTMAPESVTTATTGNELAIGGGLGDLTANELSNLLSDIEKLEPLPQTEPDVGTVSTEAPGDSS